VINLLAWCVGMRKHMRGSAVGLSAAAMGCFWLLVHCGGGGGGAPMADANPESALPDGTSHDASVPGEDVSSPGPDATTNEAAPEGGGSDAFDSGLSTLDAQDAPDDAQDAQGPPAIACDAQAACGDAAGAACCSGFCTNTAKDPSNCGQCGASCGANQFCTGTACDDAIIANVCANANGTVVGDGISVDTAAGVAIGAALAGGCVPATNITQVDQFVATGVLEPGTHRPITGPGNTLITGGGPFYQQSVAFMESALTALYLTTEPDGVHGTIHERATDAAVVDNVPVTSQHDFFYVQLTVEPRSGTLCFAGVGIGAPGTQAAGYYVSTVLIPGRATYTKNWYVFEWTDTNGDSIADFGDTYALVASAP